MSIEKADTTAIDARGFDTETDPVRPASSERLVEIARARCGNKLLLGFSGRDSLAAWLFLREHDFEVVPYWCYVVPGLSYDDQMIDYYEAYFGQHIIRLPHPILYELLFQGTWHAPHKAAMLASCNLPRFDFAGIEDKLAEEFDLGDNYLCANGMRAADNLMRLRLIRQMGVLGVKKRKFYYAIWDWKTADVKATIRRHGLKLSRAYIYWGSTGSRIDYPWLRFLKDNLPADYQRVLDCFPLVDLELFRYEQVA